MPPDLPIHKPAAHTSARPPRRRDRPHTIMRRWRAQTCAALGFSLVAFASSHLPAEAAPPSDPVSVEIANKINQYRNSLGLPSIPVSPSLTAVAQAHAADLAEHHPDRGADARGVPCNAHSWSSQGAWTPVCYTPDHRYARGMWDKPREVTRGRYTGDGFEIALSSTGPIDADMALANWRASPPHNDVITERGIFAGMNWRAMGVAVSDGYAVVWFGKQADPVP
jgi:uncharacterized protein YkwD